MFKLFTSVQAVPFQLSVSASFPGESPPKPSASVLEAPEDEKKPLASLRSATSVHADPFQDSVIPT